MSHPSTDSLISYWLGDAFATLEPHLFECEACAARLQTIADITAAIAERGTAGHVNAVVTPALLNRLACDGIRIRSYTLRCDAHVPCAVADDDQLMVARLVGDFRGTGRLEVTIDAAGQPQERMTDLAIDRADGEINLVDPADLVRQWPSLTLEIRVYDGEQLLGTYFLDHHAH